MLTPPISWLCVVCYIEKINVHSSECYPIYVLIYLALTYLFTATLDIQFYIMHKQQILPAIMIFLFISAVLLDMYLIITQ